MYVNFKPDDLQNPQILWSYQICNSTDFPLITAISNPEELPLSLKSQIQLQLFKFEKFTVRKKSFFKKQCKKYVRFWSIYE